jgi:hypothetical protein
MRPAPTIINNRQSVRCWSHQGCRSLPLRVVSAGKGGEISRKRERRGPGIGFQGLRAGEKPRKTQPSRVLRAVLCLTQRRRATKTEADNPRCRLATREKDFHIDSGATLQVLGRKGIMSRAETQSRRVLGGPADPEVLCVAASLRAPVLVPPEGWAGFIRVGELAGI